MTNFSLGRTDLVKENKPDLGRNKKRGENQLCNDGVIFGNQKLPKKK